MMKAIAHAQHNRKQAFEIANGQVQPGVLYVLQAAEAEKFMTRVKDKIWQMVQDCYTEVGGYKGQDNVRKLIKDTDVLKVVFSAADEQAVQAFAAYSKRLSGNKRFCSAKDLKDPAAAAAVELIVQDDIEDLEGFYWVEASGGIEHIFAKFGGNPIHNSLVSSILPVANDPDFKLDPDEVHYQRRVGKDHDVLRKMVFGFANRTVAAKACAAVADYELFKLAANASILAASRKPGLQEAEAEDPVLWALAVCWHMEKLRQEWECRELLPEWVKTLKAAEQILTADLDGKAAKAAKMKTSDSEQLQMKQSCLKYIKNTLHDCPRLVVRRVAAASR